MRLATVRTDDGTTRLYGGGSDGFFDLVEAAESRSMGGLARVTDVGSFLRAGPAADADARELMRDAGHWPATPLEGLRLAPPVTLPRSIVCVGRNYLEHVREGNSPVPEFPILFSKFPNTLVGHDEPVVRHAITSELDYEGELALIIGRQARRVLKDEALAFVAGYTVLNDISARDLQLGDVQWIRGKSLDTFCPLGPVFVSADEVEDPGRLQIETRVNGELRQNAPCSDMIFDIPTLLAFISEAITLEPGDLVATGTPSGTAFGMDPRRYLEPGDSVEVRITDLGTLRSPIVGPEDGR
jgi:acylpyruvate hydrolase